MVKRCAVITGASGFIGTNMTRKLLECGFSVIALDRRKTVNIFTGYNCASESVENNENFDLLTVQGDIRDSKLLKEIFLKYEPEYVIHFAALSTIQQGAIDKAETFSVNVEGTRCILEAIRDFGRIKGFFYASTDKVYGDLHKQMYEETDTLMPVDSIYDQSKAQADQMVREWCSEYGIHGIVLRFCNIYGKYDLQQSRIIPGNICACLDHKPCKLRMYRDFNGKLQNYYRDFLYVEDLCEGIWHIIDYIENRNPEEDGKMKIWGEAFNFGTGNCYSMTDVIYLILQMTGSTIPLMIQEEEIVKEIEMQCMSFKKANEYFGFKPQISLNEGLIRTIEWWKEKKLWEANK